MLRLNACVCPAPYQTQKKERKAEPKHCEREHARRHTPSERARPPTQSGGGGGPSLKQRGLGGSAWQRTRNSATAEAAGRASSAKGGRVKRRGEGGWGGRRRRRHRLGAGIKSPVVVGTRASLYIWGGDASKSLVSACVSGPQILCAARPRLVGRACCAPRAVRRDRPRWATWRATNTTARPGCGWLVGKLS